MDGPPAGLPCDRVTLTGAEMVTCVCVDQPASESEATCGVFLQAHVKSQLVRERAGRGQAAQVLQQRRERAGEMREETLSVGAIVQVGRAHHAGVNVSEEDGVSVQQRSVSPTLG